ncbi:S-adenosyl-L-methionine-dependent methyl transferase PigF [Microcystis aeruginosa NIES-1211]|jgi:2-polyprenyl-3-methyl-5-hydroxy-6-metoxy-1,4-benzoquinol methylase|uniref:methyltransferase n=1 Tax=Microcystis TaxID=1125 RepID=UPI0002622F60|nr:MULTISPECIES: methyltransferase [Microcystis]GBL15498.1 S-adenosyl-L-methionine-dependent methyl transferase PigF [Microcystis aeruginosa NIES-1211]CCI31030.1 putative Hydroxyindole O-methyltransferase [Microcystis sp. T1-4]
MNFLDIQELIIAGWKTQTLFSALELGIFEQLSQQAKTIEQLAQDCHFSPVSGKKLLTACVALGLLTKTNDTYQNASVTQELLVSGNPIYLGDVAFHIRDILPLWNKLTDAVKENSNRWQQVTGSEAGHFSSLYQDPNQLAHFLKTMNLYNQETAASVALNFDFSPYHHLLDIGGSTGVFGQMIISYFPHLKVTVFDLPEVCKITEQYIKEQYHLEGQMATHEGNFLSSHSLPKGFDIIYLGWVLHDWPHHIQLEILEKCYQALPPNGILLATESLINQEETGPLLTALLSLDMLVSTDGGGESTGEEYKERFSKAGFESVEIISLPIMRDLIVGVKKVRAIDPT